MQTTVSTPPGLTSPPCALLAAMASHCSSPAMHSLAAACVEHHVSGEAASALQPVEDVLTRVSLAETGEGASSSSTAPAPVVAASGALPPTSSKSLVFPSRPGFGTAGRRCRVRANHFVVQLADKTIYHYDIAITPESISRERNRTIIKELIRLQQQYLDGRLPVYDGRKGMFTAGPLPFTNREFLVNIVNPQRGSKGEKEYRVTITEVAKLDMYSLKQFMAGRQRELPQDTIQALDIALRECPNGRYTSISRSFFAQSFGHDISATAFYKAQPVMDFALEYLNIRDASRRLHDQDRLKLRKALKGIRVVATHRRDMSIHYKITGLTSDPLKELMFDQNGTTVSVVQYFKHQYNYSLKYVNWPCLQAGSDSRPTYLPMEVCIILEGQRYSRKLNEHQVRGILRLACERPSQREKSILEITSRNNYVNDYHAKEFGIKVTNQLALVDARVLPAPRLKYHDSGRERVCNPSVGQWNMSNKRMLNGGSIRNWACLTFSSRLRMDEIKVFCDNLVANNGRPCVDIRQVHQDYLDAALKTMHGQSQQLELLIIVLPEANTSIFYGRIKRICETELGVMSQCCLPRNVQKAGQQYLQNMALKINVKVGGRNTALEDALHRRIPLLTDLPTMIFGADVTHPPSGEDASPSIAAGRIIADLFTEVKDSQKGLVYGGMIRANGCRKPARIIFYRDGVSEGQFSQVLLYEMDAIRKICHPNEFDFYLCSHSGIQGTSRPAHYHVLFDENKFGADALQTLTYNLCYTYARCTRSVSIVSSSILCTLGGFRARHYLEDGHFDQGSTSARSSRLPDRAVPVKPLPKVKENVEQFMFYC
ncbi:hypothetical protein GUJ93_ZPchr0092g38062 [Zizania palustris]|uniref:Uncharacterized protein n=1 Tax=Zizania palustris TaxID=103762 RepID=A0A8J5QZ65_ZIZPA|nr:hypothetical protein GUJ93_ZPchr0092g38062 [Zizania palustris]